MDIWVHRGRTNMSWNRNRATRKILMPCKLCVQVHVVDLVTKIKWKMTMKFWTCPKRMAIWLTKFLKRGTNKVKAVVKGKRVNRGDAFGLEVPCGYFFMGDKFSISWLKTKLQKKGFELIWTVEHFLKRRLFETLCKFWVPMIFGRFLK